MDLVREQKFFVLHICRALLVSACSTALRPRVVPASSHGVQLPSDFLLPWGRGGTGVPVWAQHNARAERSKWGFSCSCLHQCFPELLVVWICRKAGAWKLWGSSSRKPSQSLFLYSSCSSAKKECTYSAILLCFTFPNLVIKVLAPWHLNCFY